jgi:hypothetical protein
MKKIRNKPDVLIKSRSHYNINRKELLKSLSGNSGIYVYKLKNIPIYVGATNNLRKRSVRFYRNGFRASSHFLSAIVDLIRTGCLRGDASLEIFFYPVDMLFTMEQSFLEKLKPISQIFDDGFRCYWHQLKRRSK